MQHQNSLQTFLKGLAQIVGMFIIYFVIGAGWNGLYDMYCREVRGVKPDEQKGERVGLIAFWGFVASIVLVVGYLPNAECESSPCILAIYAKCVGVFAVLSLIGFVYFWRNLWK